MKPSNPTLPAVRCQFSKLVPPAKLKANPRNPNKHPLEQLDLYAKVIQHQGWRRAVVVSKRSGLIVTGHGAVECALAQGWSQVPVDYQDFASEDDETAHMLADNRLGQGSEIDERDLSELLKGLTVDMQAVSGFDDDELSRLIALEFVGEERAAQNDITDKVPADKTVYIVPIALTREQYRKWEAVKAEKKSKGDKAAFLKVAGL